MADLTPKTIPELPSSTFAADNDLFAISRSGNTRSIPWSVMNGDKFVLGKAKAFVPQNADLDSYDEPGVYGITTNVIAGSLAHRPSDVAGTLRVWNAIGNEHAAGSSWYYVMQEYTTMDGDTWRRSGYTGAGTTVIWSSWKITNCSLTYVEESVMVSFAAGTIGTRGFQARLSATAPSGKKLIGTTILYIGDSSMIMPILFTTGTDLYLNVYRATSSAVSNNEVRVRFAFI